MTRDEVRSAAPQAPRCFADRSSWVEYLHQSQEAGKRGTAKPFDEMGQYRPAFNFCADCLPEHARHMSDLGWCDPRALRIPGAKVRIAVVPA